MKTLLLRHRLLVTQFLKFGMVGGLGFFVDAGVLMLAMKGLGLGPYAGRVVSYLSAATFTWALNRHFTFRGQGKAGHAHRQWAKFVVANLAGFAANYGTYALLVAYVPLVAATPVIGVAAGSIAGLGINFTASRLFVFQ